MNDSTLTIIEQRTVIFYDDEITAVLIEVEGRQSIYVPVRPICDFLGVSWQGQNRRIKGDEVLSGMSMSVNITLTDIEPSSRRPKTSRMLCLPLEFINGFLFGINPKRVKPEVKENLIRYQMECYRVLADAFLQQGTAVSNTEASLIQVREMGLAIARMAEEQIEFDRRLNKTETRLDQAAIIVGDVRKRLTAVEQKLTNNTAVTDEQASQISQAVKSIAMLLEQQSGRNEFQGVYGELYRRFGITSYKLLPAEKFANAMQFLTEWYINLTDDEDVPF